MFATQMSPSKVGSRYFALVSIYLVPIIRPYSWALCLYSQTDRADHKVGDGLSLAFVFSRPQNLIRERSDFPKGMASPSVNIA